MTPAASIAPGDRIPAAFERIRSEGRVGLMTHIVLGYPDLETSRQLVDCMVEAGVDLIELQIPFSDPTADGPVITSACQDALDGGLRVAQAFEFLRDVSDRHSTTPFLFMSYFNIAFAYKDAVCGGHGGADSVEGFVRATRACGGSGLILPDIPPEMRAEGYPEACRQSGVHPIYVVSPNIGDERLQKIAAVSSGFLYATSRTGTTGKEMELDATPLESFLARAHDICKLPVAVGFSISKREHVESLRGHAECAVIGSHLIRVFDRDGVGGVRRELAALIG